MNNVVVSNDIILDQNDNMCPICFEFASIKPTTCMHIYCNYCIKKIKKCALCRISFDNKFIRQIQMSNNHLVINKMTHTARLFLFNTNKNTHRHPQTIQQPFVDPHFEEFQVDEPQLIELHLDELQLVEQQLNEPHFEELQVDEPQFEELQVDEPQLVEQVTFVTINNWQTSICERIMARLCNLIANIRALININ